MKTKIKKEKILVLLDAHAILHRAYHALPDFASSSGVPTGALYGVSAMLIKIIRELKPDYISACYDLPKPTFRHSAYDDYKKGRAKTDDSLVAQIIRSRDIFKAFNIPIYEKEGFEADDILGTISSMVKKKNKDIKIIIASGDMDTLQLVDGDIVSVYTLKKGINDTIIYNEKAVSDRFGFPPNILPDWKGLRGDPSDNIIGIAGIGEKTATTLIQKFGSIENIYKKLKKGDEDFIKAGIKPRIINLLKEGEEEAIFSKMLATIRLDTPIEFTLPKETWRDSFDVEIVGKLFAELEFRKLKDRLKEVGDDGNSTDENKSSENVSKNTKNVYDEALIKKAQIAVWLINSEITSPSIEDIFDITGEDKLESAFEVLIKRLKERDLTEVFENIEVPIVSIIKEAEDTGILVDVKLLKNLSGDYHKKLSVLESEIWKLAGEEFNVNSSKQLAVILFEKMGISTKGLKKTAGGKLSTRESELLKLADEHEIIGSILSYRELQKVLSTYIDNIPAMVGNDGRLHTTLNQTGTTTGRMSSNNPNMQNIPTRGDIGIQIRNAFISEKGKTFIAFDYSQIEMRALAVLAEDEKLLETFKKGKDVHSSVASFVFGVSEEEVTKEMRRKAKVINFGIVYGMGVNALKTTLGGTRGEAQDFYNKYFETFPKIAGYFEGVRGEARKFGFTKTFFGRRRYFGGINSKIPFIRAMAERMAINAPVQGTGADIIKIAMKKTDDALKSAGLTNDAKLLLQIHDELFYEVKDSEIEKAKEVIKSAMEDFPNIPVPLVVNVTSGKRWGGME